MFKYEEDKLNGFSFVFYISMVHDSNVQCTSTDINIVLLHLAAWNTFIMSAANFVMIDSFALSYLFIKIAYLHCS